jgi:hypothetical protein
MNQSNSQYLIETPNAEYWCDDFRLGTKHGVPCIFLIAQIEGKLILSEIYDMVIAIHDYSPDITLEEFARQKEEDAEAILKTQLDLQERLRNESAKKNHAGDQAFQ